MSRLILSTLLVLGLTGCVGQEQTVRQAVADYQESVLDKASDNPTDRPAWIRKLPTEPGRMFLVTTSTDGLSAETGIRLAKAYALAQLSEQANTSIKVSSKLTSPGSTNDSISWQSAAILHSMRQDESYWERRITQEGTRYSVWVLWSIPEKAFYQAQQEAIAVGEH